MYLCTLAYDYNLAIIWPKFTSFSFLFILQFNLQMLPPASDRSDSQASQCSGLTWHRQLQKNRAEESEKSSRNSVPRALCTFHGFSWIKPRECLLLIHQLEIMKDLRKYKDTRRRWSRNSAWFCVSTLRLPLHVLL